MVTVLIEIPMLERLESVHGRFPARTESGSMVEAGVALTRLGQGRPAVGRWARPFLRLQRHALECLPLTSPLPHLDASAFGCYTRPIYHTTAFAVY